MTLITFYAVIKIYSKMWELCMYDHFVYSINFQKNANYSHKPPFFLIKPTVVWAKIFEKENISFSGLRSCYNRLANRKKLILPLEKYLFYH